MQWYGVLGIAVFAGILGGLVFNGMDFNYMIAKITPGQSESSNLGLQKLVQQAQKLAEQAKDPTRDAETLAELEQLLDDFVGSPSHVQACQQTINELQKIIDGFPANQYDPKALKRAGELTNDLYNNLFCMSIKDKLVFP